MLTIRNLTKVFPKENLSVLNSLSLTVKNHEFVSFIGPSGCGKSTLFRILSGIEKQTSGDIFLNNKKLINRKGMFGYMPQNTSLFPWKTVLENVMLGPLIKGESKKIAEEKALDLLGKFGLQKFRNNFPKTLSGGMQQRVALLRTILFNPHFLLLDEPFGSLDEITKQHAQEWLLKVCDIFHTRVLFITHDIQEAIFLSDKIYVFSNRPATLLEEVRVSLKKPRTLSTITSPQAISIEKELRSLLLKS